MRNARPPATNLAGVGDFGERGEGAGAGIWARGGLPSVVATRLVTTVTSHSDPESDDEGQ